MSKEVLLLTFDQFLNYRDAELSKVDGKKGYTIFNNETAKLVFDAKPSSLSELSKVKGFPADGERMKKYGKKIIAFFCGSNVFTGKR